MPIDFDEDKSSWAVGPAITNQPNAAAAPTKSEFDAMVARFNALLAVCRDAGLISTD